MRSPRQLHIFVKNIFFNQIFFLFFTFLIVLMLLNYKLWKTDDWIKFKFIHIVIIKKKSVNSKKKSIIFCLLKYFFYKSMCNSFGIHRVVNSQIWLQFFSLFSSHRKNHCNKLLYIAIIPYRYDKKGIYCQNSKTKELI